MEPIAIVTALVAVLYIVGRGGLAVAPTATAAFYRRQLANPRRIQIFGGLLVLIAAALVLTARQSRAAHGDITILLEVLGWLTAAGAVWVIAAPGPLRRLYSASDSTLRVFGIVNLIFGLCLGWVAFFVL
jgi:hypothetical protein